MLSMVCVLHIESLKNVASDVVTLLCTSKFCLGGIMRLSETKWIAFNIFTGCVWRNSSCKVERHNSRCQDHHCRVVERSSNFVSI